MRGWGCIDSCWLIYFLRGGINFSGFFLLTFTSSRFTGVARVTRHKDRVIPRALCQNGPTKTMSRLCQPCLDRHGAAQECVATHETEKGLPLCVFCLDGEPCLHDRKVIASQKRLSANQTTEGENMHEQGDQLTTAVAATATKKICRTPGCGRQLCRTNKSGLCNSHFASKKSANGHTAGNGANGHASKSETTAKGASHANVHAATNRANGHVSKSGKHGKLSPGPIPQKIDRDELVEERINGVMLAWPAAEKMRVVSAWLAGAI